MPMPLIAVLLLGSLTSSISSSSLSSSYIPLSWKAVCRDIVRLGSTSSSSSPFTSNVAPTLVDINCLIEPFHRHQWRLDDLMEWTRSNNINNQTTPSNRSVVYTVTVTCAHSANISLPWPMRVPGLRQLRVLYCRLLDRFKHMHDSAGAVIANEMSYLEIRHSIWIRNVTNKVMRESDEMLNITSNFDCGQDSTLETMIMSNNSVVLRQLDNRNIDVANLSDAEFTPVVSFNANLPANLADAISNWQVKPEDRLTTDTAKAVSDHANVDSEYKKQPTSSQHKSETLATVVKEAQLANIKFLIKMMKTRTKCSYKKLKLIDESISPLTSVFHFELMIQGAEYPVLEYMNYSYLGLDILPKQLAEWRIYFPKLKALDVSHNYISEIKIPHYPSTLNSSLVRFNLRHNNITTITKDTLNSWAEVDNFFIDIRDNPIHCGCDMAAMLPYLQSNDTFQGQLAPYEYVRHMTCSTPEAVAGLQLLALTKDLLVCPVNESNKTAVIVLGVVMAVFIALIIVVIRFKIEIRILLYTRLHLRLPCDADSLGNNKQFDAFISYSNEDTTWVCENLIKFLEKSPAGATSAGKSPNNSHKYQTPTASHGQRSFKLCVHQRDFIPGKTIFDNIVDSIEASRHTIIVLSPSFMRSHWAMEELRQAYRQSLVEKTRHLIVILLEKVSKDEMDPLIQRCCKTFTYLEVGDSLFRDRLVFSLTTKDRGAKRRDRLAAMNETRADNCDHQAGETSVYDTVADSSGYDNTGDLPSSGRPPEPVRELSNMSTSSTSPLHPC